ncbi:MAG: CBS domain-containing protein [Nanoarchaeota archaeon]
MQEEIKYLKNLRKNLNLSQKGLAQHAGVSQSLIAKIESGQLDPAYSKYKQISKALLSLTQKKQKKASDVMVKNIKTVSPAQTIKQAISKMKKHNISQLPVFEEGYPIGLVTDSVMLNAVSSGKKTDTKLAEVMDDAPPTVNKKAEVSLIVQILKYYPIVVVYNREKAEGVITKADLFSMLGK